MTTILMLRRNLGVDCRDRYMRVLIGASHHSHCVFSRFIYVFYITLCLQHQFLKIHLHAFYEYQVRDISVAGGYDVAG